MTKRILTFGIGMALVISLIAGAKAGNQVENKINILLKCAVIVASAEDGHLGYEEYVVAASYLAADTGRSLEWLDEKVSAAFATASHFSEQQNAARQCVETLDELKE